MLERIRERRWLLVPALVVAGALLGLIAAFALPSTRRAQAEVLITAAGGSGDVAPLLSDVRELATGGVLAGNVRSTLRLNESAESVRHRIHASVRPHSNVIVLTATAGRADRARQLAQEAAVVLTQLVGPRFRQATPPLRASLLDPGHVVNGGDRHILRDVTWGAIVGLIFGLLAAALVAGGEVSPRTVSLSAPEVPAATAAPDAGAHERDLDERERLLDQRVGLVTERELRLARRAAALSAQERALAARRGELEEQERRLAEAPPPQPEPKPEPAPEPEPPPAVAPEPVVAPATAGAWNLDELARRVDAEQNATPEQVEEWRTYLFHLRAHADIDGNLPPNMDSLVADVFAQLIV